MPRARTSPGRCCVNLRRLIQGVVLAAALGGGAAEAAQPTYADLSGTWWFELGGDDAGALVIGLGTPHQGQIPVEDAATGQPSFGFSRAIGGPFLVAPGQMLTFDSKRNVVGALALTDPVDGSDLGTLTLTRGKADKRIAHWKGIGSLVANQGNTYAARLSGKRLPQTFPVLSGGNSRAQLFGKGVKSEGFDLHVTADSALGAPAYAFDGAGPVEIDRVEVPFATLSGRFVLTPSFHVVGSLSTSSHFGTGSVSGQLRLPGKTLVPRARLDLMGSRKLSARAKLTEAIDPVLAVAPKSLDFGAAHLNGTRDLTLSVRNVGAGVLAGEAQLLPGSSSAFRFVSGEQYAGLAPTDPPHVVVVRFAPTVAGDATAQILLDVGGGRVGAQLVALTGVGGIGQIDVTPTTIDFPALAIGGESFVAFTVSNAGDGILEGSATIAGSSDFALAETDGGSGVLRIDYSLDPGDQRTLFARFRPSRAGNQSATITLSGGGGASLALTGSTP